MINNIGKLYTDVIGNINLDPNCSEYVKVLWSWIKSLFKLNQSAKTGVDNVNYIQKLSKEINETNHKREASQSHNSTNMAI